MRGTRNRVMETTCVIPKPQKKQKLNRKCLGNLPEEILRHILSFLPTKDAVRTSLLSKRWEYLWASIPNLHFRLFQYPPAEEKRKRKLFMNFVDRALCLRDSSVIKRFALRCDVRCDASRVYTWISAVLRHNVQELYIQLEFVDEQFSLPYRLFTCKTLTRLHLNMWSMILKLPTTICFSNLKILTIKNVIFPHEYLTRNFFSGLPVLEKLKLKDCSWESLSYLIISPPKLHTLSIIEMDMPDDSLGQVMISGDSLKEFYYYGFMDGDYCLNFPFSLEKAEVYALTEETIPDDQFAYRMHKLLSGLSNVKFLKLHAKVFKIPNYGTGLSPHMPMFKNLMDLAFFKSSVDLDCEALLKTLQGCPCLENLKFLGGVSLSSNCEEDDWILDPVPSCFLSHLKFIKVDRYYGSKKELSAVKILLKNSVVLDEIVITCKDHFEWDIEEQDHLKWNLEKQEDLYKQLVELPRGSQNCKIVLDRALFELIV